MNTLATIPPAQHVVNQANWLKDFTYHLNDSDESEDSDLFAPARYVVSMGNIYKGKNPSLDCNLLIKVSDRIKENMYDSISGRLDKDTGEYSIDANIHFNHQDLARKVAGDNVVYDLKS